MTLREHYIAAAVQGSMERVLNIINYEQDDEDRILGMMAVAKNICDFVDIVLEESSGENK